MSSTTQNRTTKLSGPAALFRFATLFGLALAAQSQLVEKQAAVSLIASAESASFTTAPLLPTRFTKRSRSASSRVKRTHSSSVRNHVKRNGTTESTALGSFTWSNTSFLFGFGDSYSTTGWTPEDGVFSEDIQETTSNGPNWLGYITGTYNSSEIYMRNLARSGATIADELVKISDHEHPVLAQVGLFEEHLSPQEGLDWKADDTLFTMWVGVNDVGLSYDWENQTEWHGREFEVWYGLQERLYTAGARNFLHLTAPPTFRVPLFQKIGWPTIEWVEEALKDYNRQLRENLVRFQEEHDDAVVMLFDAHKEFGKILDDATEHGFKNASRSCWAYQRGTDSPTSLNEEACVNPVNEYFWIDDYHPNTPVHKLLAEKVKEFLISPRRVTDIEEST